MSGTPLRDVLSAIAGGAGSFDRIAERTGLAEDVCRVAVDHLVRAGRLQARELAVGCPASGCGGCASGRPDGSAGCGAIGPSSVRRGPTLVAFSLTTPRAADAGR